MAVQFAVLASGSRGNAALVRSGGPCLLLDLGLGPRALATRMESVGSGWDEVTSAVLTHTHGDHVDNHSLHQLAQRRAVLYCHEGHRRELRPRSGFQALDDAGLVRHYDDRPFLATTGIWIEPIELRHDGGPTFGFRIEAKPRPRKRSVAIGYLADTGSWSPAMVDQVAEADVLGVEFNHDEDMQRASPRSPALIARNLGDHGHLSNAQAAGFVSEVIARSARGTLRHLILLHMSQQCNTPTLALRSAEMAIRGKGRRIQLHAAQQNTAFPNVMIEPGRRRTLVSG